MIILVLTFFTLFLAIFSPSLVLLYKLEQARELRARAREHAGQIPSPREAAWGSRKHMLMG